MLTMTFSLLAVAAIAIVSAGLGAAGYRYMLKRNPAKLEQWAQQIKAAGERAQAKIDQ